MLYIDYIGNHTFRMCNHSGGNGYRRYFSDHVVARSDENDRVWIEDSDTRDGILNCYPVSDITLDGTVYSSAEDFVNYFNVNVHIGSLLNPIDLQFNIDEGTTEVGQIDETEATYFTITVGSEDFSIDNSGNIAFISAPDYEVKNLYNLRVKSNKGKIYVITVNVMDVQSDFELLSTTTLNYLTAI